MWFLPKKEENNEKYLKLYSEVAEMRVDITRLEEEFDIVRNRLNKRNLKKPIEDEKEPGFLTPSGVVLR